MIGEMSRRIAILVFAGALTTSCSESTVCTAEGQRGIELSIRTADGVDVGVTTWVELVRLDRIPVDSAQGLHDMARGSPIAAADSPGRYRVRVRRDGFVPQERLVTVPGTGSCNEVVTQNVILTLVPTI